VKREAEKTGKGLSRSIQAGARLKCESFLHLMIMELKPFHQRFFPASGNIHRTSIAHHKIATLSANIFGYLIQINEIGVMHTNKMGKIVQLLLHFFQSSQAMILFLFLRKRCV